MHSPENRMPFPLSGALAARNDLSQRLHGAKQMNPSLWMVSNGIAPFLADEILKWSRPDLSGLLRSCRPAPRRSTESKKRLCALFSKSLNHLPWLAFIIAQNQMPVKPFFKKIIHEIFSNPFVNCMFTEQIWATYTKIHNDFAKQAPQNRTFFGGRGGHIRPVKFNCARLDGRMFGHYNGEGTAMKERVGAPLRPQRAGRAENRRRGARRTWLRSFAREPGGG